MKVLRVRLSADDYAPTSIRWNADCDCVQITPDGGTTWNEDEAGDPRINPAFLLPPNTEPDVKCAAAGGMMTYVRQCVDLAIDRGDAVGLANALMGVALVFIPLAPLIALVYAIAQALVAIGASALLTNFTEDVYDQLLCIFFCHVDPDGRLDAAALEEVLEDVSVKIANFTVQSVMELLVQQVGFVGLSNAGAKLADSEAECDDCDCGWCHEQNFEDSDNDYNVVVSGSLAEGNYVAAKGFEEVIVDDACLSHGYLNIYFDLPGGANCANIDSVQIFYQETNHDGTVYFIDQNDGAGSILTRSSWAAYTTPGDIFPLVGNASATRLAIVAFPCGQTVGNPAFLFKLIWRGHDVSPFGADNC